MMPESGRYQCGCSYERRCVCRRRGAFHGGGVSARSWEWRHASRGSFALRHVDFDIRPGSVCCAWRPLAQIHADGWTGRRAWRRCDDGEQEGRCWLVAGTHVRRVESPAWYCRTQTRADDSGTRVGDDVAFGCETWGCPKTRSGVPANHWISSDLTTCASTIHASFPVASVSASAPGRCAAMHPGLLLMTSRRRISDPDGVKEVHDAVKHVVEQTGKR